MNSIQILILLVGNEGVEKRSIIHSCSEKDFYRRLKEKNINVYFLATRKKH